MDSQASRFSDSELLDAGVDGQSTASSGFTDITPLPSSPVGYALVFKAQRMGKWHVLKCLRASHADNPLYQSLLRKEFDICYTLQSPNIVQTIGLEQVPSLGLCIVEEYIDGQSLQALLNVDAPISERTALKIISELCDALAYVHARQIVHRDLKPSNILLTANGQNLKLIDFGFADADSFAVLKQPAGTRRYAAPEQMRGEQVDARADIYALGQVIGELNDRLRHPSRRLRRIADKCRRADKRQRFQSALEVKEALQHRSHALMVALSALFLVLLFALFLWQQNRPTAPSLPEVKQKTETETTHDTIVVPATKQLPTPTEKNLEQQPNTVERAEESVSTAESAPEDLGLRIQRKTKEILEEAYRKISDTSLPTHERLDTYGQSFTEAELMVRREVDAAHPEKDDANRRLQTEMHELMRQTYKQYNLDNQERIRRLMQAFEAEQQHKEKREK